MQPIFTTTALALAFSLAGTAQANAPIRAADGISLYVGIDGLQTIASGTYAGLANPNAGRLTLLFDHGDHYHSIGAYSLLGTAAASQVAATNANNRLPELYTRLDAATSAIELTSGTGAFAGSWVSGVLPASAPTYGYSFLGMASAQSLQGLSAAANVLFNSSGGRWSGTAVGVTAALKLEAVTSGLKVAVGSNNDVFAGGIGSLYTLGSGAQMSFDPTFHVAATAAPGTYTAQFSLVNLGSQSAAGSSGTFFFDFAVPSPVPEPGTWLMWLAGLGAVALARRNKL